jgi:hypothetical protein
MLLLKNGPKSAPILLGLMHKGAYLSYTRCSILIAAGIKKAAPGNRVRLFRI